jgi:hypothetical protein
MVLDCLVVLGEIISPSKKVLIRTLVSYNVLKRPLLLTTKQGPSRWGTALRR